MPKAPITHSIKSVGKSHSAEIKTKRANAMAYQRQKSRQYKTNSKTWRNIRADYLKRNPLCVDCEKEGITKIATVLDHKDGDSWNNSQSNYQGQCIHHHAVKTAKYDGSFGNKKRKYD